jgi:hypothetical protein
MFHETSATDFFTINTDKPFVEDSAVSDATPVLDSSKVLGFDGILGDTNDINNVSTQGLLRNIGYADIDYFEQDYVGDSRTLF